MPNHKPASSVPADPEKWSDKSKHSISYDYVREYKDIEYNCRRCKAPSVFTAKDQKYTFEVKKASIDQQRILCDTCWLDAIKIRASLAECATAWTESKKVLQHDDLYLKRWLDLLVRLEEYVPYKPDTARKNMLGKLLARITSRPNGSPSNRVSKWKA